MCSAVGGEGDEGGVRAVGTGDAQSGCMDTKQKIRLISSGVLMLVLCGIVLPNGATLDTAGQWNLLGLEMEASFGTMFVVILALILGIGVIMLSGVIGSLSKLINAQHEAASEVNKARRVAVDAVAKRSAESPAERAKPADGDRETPKRFAAKSHA